MGHDSRAVWDVTVRVCRMQGQGHVGHDGEGVWDARAGPCGTRQQECGNMIDGCPVIQNVQNLTGFATCMEFQVKVEQMIE